MDDHVGRVLAAAEPGLALSAKARGPSFASSLPNTAMPILASAANASFSDIWRTLADGIDFVTGVPLADEWEQSRKRPGVGRAGQAHRGAAQVAMLAALFAGDTVVLPPHFDAHEVWRAVERHKVNLI